MALPENTAEEAIQALSSLPLHEFVYTTLSLVNLPFGEVRVDPSAAAADYAVAKIEQHVRALHAAEERRRQLGLAARAELQRAEELRATDPESADEVAADAVLLGAEQEVEWHYFTTSARTIQRLLALAARLVGVTIQDEDDAKLRSYAPLRNVFEHLDERLPGEQKSDRLVLEDSDSTRLVIGLKSDAVGRFTVPSNGVDIVAEVNAVGVWEIEHAVTNTLNSIGAKCVELLENEFAAHPEKVPRIEDIKRGRLSRRRLIAFD